MKIANKLISALMSLAMIASFTVIPTTAENGSANPEGQNRFTEMKLENGKVKLTNMTIGHENEVSVQKRDGRTVYAQNLPADVWPT